MTSLTPSQLEAAREAVKQLRSMTLLFKMSLLSTTVEIARQAKPLVAEAEAAIAAASAAGIGDGE